MADAENPELGPADYLERALADVNTARQETAADAMSVIDSAIGRLREALARVPGRRGGSRRTPEGTRGGSRG